MFRLRWEASQVTRRTIQQFVVSRRLCLGCCRYSSSNCRNTSDDDDAFQPFRPPISPELKPFTRLPVPDENHGSEKESYVPLESACFAKKSLDTGFVIQFLGTGAGNVSIHRSNAATTLRIRGKTLLFDAGEGTQRQIFRAGGIRPKALTRIFITHMHADHVNGLPGLLLQLQASHEEGSLVKIYGPVGLFNYLSVCHTLTACTIRALRVEVHELVPSTGNVRQPARAKRTYPEFGQPGLVRKAIRQNSDQTWTLETSTVASDSDPEQMKTQSNNNETSLFISAGIVWHTPRLMCFGYTVQEPDRLGKIDADKAIAAGVRPGPKFDILKHGRSVQSDDDENVTVHAADVLISSTTRGRKFSLLGDCFHVPESTLRLCEDTDVLVHEATIWNRDSEKQLRAKRGGHSSPTTAGEVACRVNASVLALTHLPSALLSNSDVKSHSFEAQKLITGRGGRSRVLAAVDLLELLVPLKGFPFIGPAANGESVSG